MFVLLALQLPILNAWWRNQCIEYSIVEDPLKVCLKEVYNKSTALLLGPGYHEVLYVNRSFHSLDNTDSTIPVTLNDVLNVRSGDRVLIKGGPGAGKTRLTHRITQLWTENKVLKDCYLFPFRLRWFREKQDLDLSSALSWHLDGSMLHSLLNKTYHSNGRNMCLVLDGLDEYEPGYTDFKNFFYQLLHGQKLPNAIVLVTSRNVTSSGFESIVWSSSYHITEFSDRELSLFFDSIHIEFNMTTLIQKHENLWLMCHNPLHASLLVKTFNDEKVALADYSTRTELFTGIVRRAFERDMEKSWEPGKYPKFGDLSQLVKDPIIRSIISLAYNGSFSKPQQYSFDDSQIPAKLKWTNISLLKIEPQPGASNMEIYTFTHPSLMEFLAAVHLTTLKSKVQSKIIADHSLRYELEYVWIFFCGLTNAFASHFQELYNST